MSQHVDTNQRIVETATALMQARGYNAFSYADIADQIGIRKASIHYYYPSKSDLAQAAVARYRTRVHAALDQIARETSDAYQRLEHYVALSGSMLNGANQMCLCALLAAEQTTLPDDVRAEIQQFYAEQTNWLQEVVQSGVEAGSLRIAGSPQQAAQLLLAGVEGAMLAARVYRDLAHYKAITGHLLASYRSTSA